MATKLYGESDPQNLKEILYEYFSSYFVWNNKEHFWIKSQRGQQVGRLVAVHPSTYNGEIFCLSSFLKHVPGATSLTNLRTVNGTLYLTYCSSCIALELLEYYLIWKKTLKEATLWARSKLLCSLFATISLVFSPSWPKELFDAFTFLWQKIFFMI